jgi:hypothetical protein
VVVTGVGAGIVGRGRAVVVVARTVVVVAGAVVGGTVVTGRVVAGAEVVEVEPDGLVAVVEGEVTGVAVVTTAGSIVVVGEAAGAVTVGSTVDGADAPPRTMHTRWPTRNGVAAWSPLTAKSVSTAVPARCAMLSHVSLRWMT